MSDFVWAMVVGLIAVAVGLGLITGFELGNLKATIVRKGAGGLLSLLGLIAFAVGVAGILGWLGSKDSPPMTAPTSSPSATSAQGEPGRSDASGPATPDETQPGPLEVTIERPDAGALVPLEGTEVSGTITGTLDDLSVWLFTVSDGLWYLTGAVTVEDDGSFQINSGQIGTSGEEGKRFTLEIIVANPDEADKILEREPNGEGDIVFTSRPGEKADSVKVERQPR